MNSVLAGMRDATLYATILGVETPRRYGVRAKSNAYPKAIKIRVPDEDPFGRVRAYLA
jgi:hypothetical protein